MGDQSTQLFLDDLLGRGQVKLTLLLIFIVRYSPILTVFMYLIAIMLIYQRRLINNGRSHRVYFGGLLSFVGNYEKVSLVLRVKISFRLGKAWGHILFQNSVREFSIRLKIIDQRLIESGRGCTNYLYRILREAIVKTVRFSNLLFGELIFLIRVLLLLWTIRCVTPSIRLTLFLIKGLWRDNLHFALLLMLFIF